MSTDGSNLQAERAGFDRRSFNPLPQLQAIRPNPFQLLQPPRTALSVQWINARGSLGFTSSIADR